jgi:hypothetical protein
MIARRTTLFEEIIQVNAGDARKARCAPVLVRTRCLNLLRRRETEKEIRDSDCPYLNLAGSQTRQWTS